MSGNLTFTIPGTPQGKGRPRFTKTGGVYTPNKTASYEETIRGYACYAMNQSKLYKFDGPVEVYLHMMFAPPKSFSKQKRENALNQNTFPVRKPDIDNVIKVYLDSLNEVAFKDDAQVCRVVATKTYAEKPSVLVIVCNAYIAIRR